MTRRAVVTGGGGFVGRFLIQRLLKEGYSVASVARSDYPNLRALGVETFQADLASDGVELAPIFHRADVIFHVAAKVDMWGRYEEFYRANVLATRRIIAAAQAEQVPSLIYTSSPSVVADGKDLCGIDESYPYPERYLAHYPATKAIAEREVLAANGHKGIRTLALRPHLIWGPGDVNLIPTVIERARAGRLVRIGAGDNLSDFTYIDDCIDAHFCAMQALDQRPESAGKAYFISQGTPVKLWWWIDQILAKAKLPPIRRSVPRPVAETLAWVFESITQLSGSGKEPLLTRFLVKEMATSHYFNIAMARDLLGYNPQLSTAQRLDNFNFVNAE